MASFSGSSASRALDGVNLSPLEFPTWVSGLTIAPLGVDRVIVSGLATNVLLRGEGIVDALTRMAELADGTRSGNDLASELPLKAKKKATQLVSLCTIRGILQERSGRQATRTTDYVSRFVAERGTHTSGVRAVEEAKQKSIAIMGERIAVDNLKQLLGDCGISLGPAETADIVVRVLSSHKDVADCDAAGREMTILAAASEQSISLGVSSPGSTSPCTECMRQRVVQKVGEGPATEPTKLLLAATVAHYVCTNVFGNSSVNVVGSVLHRSLQNWGDTWEVLGRTVSCANCVSKPAEVSQLTEKVWQYEELVGFSNIASTAKNQFLRHFEDSNIALVTRKYNFLTGDRKGIDEELARLSEIERLGFSALWKSVGLRGASEKVARYAPTGGNLGSPIGYILRNSGTKPCWLRIDPVHGELVVNEVQAEEAVEKFCRTLLPDGCLVALVSDTGAVVQKYADFAMKVCGLDSGVATACLAGACLTEGLTLDVVGPTNTIRGSLRLGAGEILMDTYWLSAGSNHAK